MAKPLPPPSSPAQHHLDLIMTVGGETFSLKGVFTLDDGLAAFDHWVEKLREGDSLTPAQLATLLQRSRQTRDRAVAVAAALKALDAQNP